MVSVKVSLMMLLGDPDTAHASFSRMILLKQDSLVALGTCVLCGSASEETAVVDEILQTEPL